MPVTLPPEAFLWPPPLKWFLEKSLTSKFVFDLNEIFIPSIYSIKKAEKTIPFKERAGIVSAIKYVDEVIPQIDKNKQKIVDKYNVNAISVGDDWKGRYPEVTCEIIFFPIGFS